MDKELLSYIEEHTYMLSEIIKISEKIHANAKSVDLDSLLFDVENRERLINILGYIQRKIEDTVGELKAEEIGQEILDTLGQWRAKVSTKLQIIKELDEQIVEYLCQNKDKITKEIGVIFQLKQRFKGYNLNNVKR